jgi:drug/metabolite transporter (DMT)-like permease
VLGIINAALPMTLVAWGETHIDSSIAGIAQASVPIFVAILGLRFLPHDPLRAGQMVGLAIGLAGVALITGFHPDGGTWAVAGTFAVVLSSLSYASGGIYGQLRVHDTPGPVLATGSMIAGALVLVPLAIADPPTQAPGTTALAGLLALALVPTFLGQLLLFRILRLFGSRRLSLVTFLMPGFAVVYGALLLDEPVSGAALAGLALILAGVLLASGQRLFGVRVQQEPA